MNTSLIIKLASAVLGGAAVGVVVGVKIGADKGRKEAWVAAEAEMDDMEDRLKRLYKIGEYSAPFSGTPGEIVVPRKPGVPSIPLGTTNETKEAWVEDGVVDPEQLAMLQKHIEGQGYAIREEEGQTLFDMYRNEDPVEEPVDLNPNQDDPEPYVISEAEFTHDEETYDKISVSYYPADQVVADPLDRVVDDVESTIGLNNLAQIPDGVTTLYVRNNRLQADFEIAIEVGSYRETVLGMDMAPAMERRGRKTRSSQDD